MTRVGVLVGGLMALASFATPASAHLTDGLLHADRGPAPAFPQAAGVKGPQAIGFMPEALPFHGIGGDTRVVFLVQPSAAAGRPVGVRALDRHTGAAQTDVPPPPSGWRTPLSIELEEWTDDGGETFGTFLILDAGGPPSKAGQVRTMVHRYAYRYRPGAGLSAEHLAAHALPLPTPDAPAELPSGIVYTDGFVRLPGGDVAVNDTITGTIWVAGPTLEDWRLAAVDADFLPAFAQPARVVGRAPGGGTRESWFWTPGGAYPGIHSMAHVAATDEVCMVRTAPPGGIFCMSRSVLLDTARLPVGKPKRTVVAPQVGLSDATDGLAHDRYHPDSPWLYWARAVADVRFGGVNVMRRVNVLTGRIEEVARSNVLYDFTSNIAALPPLGNPAATVIASAVGQEQNNPEVNALLLGQAMYVAPVPVPAVEITP